MIEIIKPKEIQEIEEIEKKLQEINEKIELKITIKSTEKWSWNEWLFSH